MKKSIVILLLLISVKSFAQSENNNPRLFNVKMFGAVGDDATDNTVAFQNCINAAVTSGVFHVYVPKGVYRIGGAIQTNVGGINMNAQLYIPWLSYSNAARGNLIIEGESAPNFTVGTGIAAAPEVPVQTSAVIIKSTLSTFTAAGQAVIGTGFSGYNYNYLTVKNIQIVVKNNPSGTGPVVGGINYRYGASLICKNVVVSIDTSGTKSVAPQNDVTGIETSNESSETMNNIENTLVMGFRNGFKLGEHVVLNQVQAMCCYRGITLKNGFHTTASARAGTFWCAYDIYVEGYCTLANFQFDTEWQQAGKWYDDVFTIKDSANLADGQVFYTIIEANVGKNNARFAKSGGDNIHALSNDEGIASGSISGMAIGSTVTSGTAGSALYLGTSGVLAQDNTNYFWDASNKRLGIGTNSATHKLEILTATSWDGIGVTNTSAATSAGLSLTNNVGAKATLQSYSSGGPYPNAGAVGADFDLHLTSGGLVASAGTSKMIFNTGGYAQPRMTLYPSGTLALNTVTDSTSAKLIVNGTGSFTGLTATGLTAPTVAGSVASGGNLTLSSTSHATKGKILFGTSAYDEVNNRLGIGTASPGFDFTINKTVTGYVGAYITNLSTASGNVGATFQVSNSATNGQMFKTGTGYTTYKTIGASDLGFYNSGAGNISILNDFGTILLTAGAGTTPHLTVATTGMVTVGAANNIVGTATNNNATAGNIGEEVNAIVSTYTNYTTTATYQNITSITLTAGDWDISAFMTYSSNSATITASANAVFVISTTTASGAGATEGKNISYVPQAALLGTSAFSESISPYRVSISGSTTYYLNTQATFTLGNPQYVGGLRARRMR